MKKILLSTIAYLLCLIINAQAPNSFNYQAVARDGNGAPITSQNVSVRFSIIQTSTSGTAIYTETHATQTDELGLFTLRIGEGTVVEGDMATINWGDDIYFLKVEVDITGGATYVDMGTTQLLSVPYAIHATSANTALSATTAETATDDNDRDNSNEIQRFSYNGDTLFLSDANWVIIPGLGDAQTDPNASWAPGYNWVDTRDGQSYATVQIGTMVWMAENLNYGDTALISRDMQNDGNVEKYCYGDIIANCDSYGGLYQWNEVMAYTASNNGETQGICPTGWHVPNLAERDLLVEAAGTVANAGANLALAGTTHWTTDFGLNSLGFNALGAGRRRTNPDSDGLMDLTIFWFSEENPGTPGNGYYMRIINNQVALDLSHSDKNYGYSVRCVKDTL